MGTVATEHACHGSEESQPTSLARSQCLRPTTPTIYYYLQMKTRLRPGTANLSEGGMQLVGSKVEFTTLDHQLFPCKSAALEIEFLDQLKGPSGEFSQHSEAEHDRDVINKAIQLVRSELNI
jgi:hypothetical protein